MITCKKQSNKNCGKTIRPRKILKTKTFVTQIDKHYVDLDPRLGGRM